MHKKASWFSSYFSKQFDELFKVERLKKKKKNALIQISSLKFEKVQLEHKLLNSKNH